MAQPGFARNPGARRPYRLQSPIQIRSPDIPAIHYAERQQQVAGCLRQSLRELASAADQVQVHARDRQPQSEFLVRTEVREVRHQENLGTAGRWNEHLV
jgi:hypothetical protein